MTRVASGPFQRDVWSVFGVPVDAVTLEQAVARVRSAVVSRERLSFVTPNLNWLVRALREPAAMQQIRRADLSLADGAPVVWLARKLGAPLTERVAGSDLFNALREKQPGQKPLRVFFFGGREGAAEAAKDALNAEDGGLIGCGALNPGYGSVAEMGAPVMLDTINRARPDFVVVSLGAAKGQDWITRYQGHLEAPVIAHLGAVVDFVGGTVPRAPDWMARTGLEWLWRIYAEPALWRRYFSDGRRFLGMIPGRLWVQHRDERYLKPAGPLTVDASKAGGAFHLSLSGDAIAAHLDELRPMLRRALDAGVNVQLDASGLGLVDGAALAHLALLEGHLTARGARLQVSGLTPVQSDIFKRMGLGAAIAPRPTEQSSQGVPAQ